MFQFFNSKQNTKKEGIITLRVSSLHVFLVRGQPLLNYLKTDSNLIVMTSNKPFLEACILRASKMKSLGHRRPKRALNCNNY